MTPSCRYPYWSTCETWTDAYLYFQENDDKNHAGIANLGHYEEWYFDKFPQEMPSKA